MEDDLVNALSLVDIIKLNNISVDFLKSSLSNEEYHNSEFDYDNLFWKFNYSFDNFFSLLQKSESELLELRVVSELTIDKLTKFFSEHNCHIGMFTNFTITSLYAIQNEKFNIEDLTPEERTLSLVFIQCLVKTFSNDMELGKEIRNIFTHLK
jgi:hypothetical protein